MNKGGESQMKLSMVLRRTRSYHVRTNSAVHLSIYKPHTTQNSFIRSDEGLTIETSPLETLSGGHLHLVYQLS